MIAVSVLFVTVSLMDARGTGPKLSVQCNAADSCTVTASGLGANTSYQLDVTDSCGATLYTSAENSNSAGALSTTITAGESSGCAVTSWTFYLYTIGRRPSQVAIYVVKDAD
jgi:hypothetical protein